MTTSLLVAKIRYAWVTVCVCMGDDVEEGLHGSRKSSKSGYNISEEIIEVIDVSRDDDFLVSSQDKVRKGLHESMKSSKSG